MIWRGLGLDSRRIVRRSCYKIELKFVWQLDRNMQMQNTLVECVDFCCSEYGRWCAHFSWFFLFVFLRWPFCCCCCCLMNSSQVIVWLLNKMTKVRVNQLHENKHSRTDITNKGYCGCKNTLHKHSKQWISKLLIVWSVCTNITKNLSEF